MFIFKKILEIKIHSIVTFFSFADSRLQFYRKYIYISCIIYVEIFYENNSEILKFRFRVSQTTPLFPRSKSFHILFNFHAYKLFPTFPQVSFSVYSGNYLSIFVVTTVDTLPDKLIHKFSTNHKPKGPEFPRDRYPWRKWGRFEEYNACILWTIIKQTFEMPIEISSLSEKLNRRPYLEQWNAKLEKMRTIFFLRFRSLRT